ncbi:hypothetical protein ILUMI_17599 [Ignelater luminosus]|uniref:Uncharacterized protein n=1 Tax=Ignelater luminosus TaxID=2038154 RepID=A0A8K0CQ67_IGNLU|nr:hypothetical protein ILUMI_17599 [Ignelater luminosus]
MCLNEKEQKRFRRLLQELNNEEDQHNKGLLSCSQDLNPNDDSEAEIDSEERQEKNSNSEQDISDSEQENYNYARDLTYKGKDGTISWNKHLPPSKIS